MKPIRSFEDATKAFQELFNWRDSFRTSDLDLKGKKIVNVGIGSIRGDVATMEQLPSIPKQDQILYPRYYGIPWSIDGVPTTTDLVVKYPIESGREGIPYKVRLTAHSAPSGGPLAININVRTYDPVSTAPTDTEILVDNLELADGQTKGVFTSGFISGPYNLGTNMEVWPVIKDVNGASGVTIVLVVKLF